MSEPRNHNLQNYIHTRGREREREGGIEREWEKDDRVKKVFT